VTSTGTQLPWLSATAGKIAEAVPDGRFFSFGGRFHNVSPAVLVPALATFYLFGRGVSAVTSVVAQITQSLDGYLPGPDDGPGKGLGEGGERLHYWVFNGPWSYAEAPTGEPAGVDKEILDEGVGRTGAVIGGRSTYEAAEAWGGENPWGIPFFILTHRTDDEPSDAGFTFVSGLESAMQRRVRWPETRTSGSWAARTRSGRH